MERLRHLRRAGCWVGSSFSNQGLIKGSLTNPSGDRHSQKRGLITDQRGEERKGKHRRTGARDEKREEAEEEVDGWRRRGERHETEEKVKGDKRR